MRSDKTTHFNNTGFNIKQYTYRIPDNHAHTEEIIETISGFFLRLFFRPPVSGLADWPAKKQQKTTTAKANTLETLQTYNIYMYIISAIRKLYHNFIHGSGSMVVVSRRNKKGHTAQQMLRRNKSHWV